MTPVDPRSIEQAVSLLRVIAGSLILLVALVAVTLVAAITFGVPR